MTHSPNDGSPEELNRDALLLRLLNTPPQPRDERKRPRAKAGKEPSRIQVSRASQEKTA